LHYKLTLGDACVLEYPTGEVLNEASSTVPAPAPAPLPLPLPLPEPAPAPAPAPAPTPTPDGGGDGVLDCPDGEVTNVDGDACVQACAVGEFLNVAGDACVLECADGEVTNVAGDACEADAFAFDPLACGFSDGDIVTSLSEGETCLDCMIAHCDEEVDRAKNEWDFYYDEYDIFYGGVGVDNWPSGVEEELIFAACYSSGLRTCMLESEPAATLCMGTGACFCQGLVSSWHLNVPIMGECPADFPPPP